MSLFCKVRCIIKPFDNFVVRSMSNIRQDAFVNGQWIQSSSNETFTVNNPVNGDVIGKVPNCTVSDVENSIGVAADSFKTWSQTTAKERSLLLRKWFNIINENSEHLSSVLSLEAGKPLDEAKGEVVYGNSFIEWFSEEARRIYGEVVPSPVHSKAIFHVKQPIGVTAVITPWNFPVAMITRKVGAALAAGCTVVIKPAEDTPLSALALADYALAAGIPPGVINVVTCDRDRISDIGKTLCQHPSVSCVTFTGSTNVGKKLMELCSPGVKRICLELGGNAPFIVFSSANIDDAITGLIASKFRNSGQTCVSANRVLIQEEIFDVFVKKLQETMKSKYFLESGEMTDKHILSPMINEAQLLKVESIVCDAIEKGATVHCGGKRAQYRGELFYEPTLLTGVSEKMLCYGEEIFGPVVSCVKFSSEEEALQIANGTNRGLAGYFYSNDLSQVTRVASRLEVGMVGINEGIISTTEAAFGGVKESGLGREGSHFGIDEFIQVKYICLGGLPK